MNIEIIRNRYKEKLLSYGTEGIEFTEKKPFSIYSFTFAGNFQEEIHIRIKINDLDDNEAKLLNIIGILDKHLELRDESN